MVITPVKTAHQTVSRSRARSWSSFDDLLANGKANDNPAFEITRHVPSEAVKGQFLDLLS